MIRVHTLWVSISSRLAALNGGLVVAALAFFVYANSLGNGFVSDDHSVILNHPVLSGPVIDLFHTIDTTSDTELLPYYRPLTYLTFLVENRLHAFDPLWMHLVNVLLHTINSLLVYLLAKSLLQNRSGALLAGTLFAVHPIGAEAVNFLSGGRNTLLACFFSLSAYLLHRHGIDKRGLSTAIAGGTLFLAGLFSKESAMMILPFIVALEIPRFRQGEPGSRIFSAVSLVPYVLAMAVYMVLRWETLEPLGIQSGFIPGMGEERLEGVYVIPGLRSRLAENIFIVPRYLLTLVWPVALSSRHVIPDDFNLLALPLAAGWLVVIAAVLWLLTGGRSRASFFGLGWSVAFWLPVSGIFYFSSVTLADRFMYAPSIGVWIILADQAGRFAPSSTAARRRAIAAVAVAVTLLATLTVRRNADWKDDMTLFSRLVQQYPDNQFGHFNLGSAFITRKAAGDLERAEQEFETALSLDPSMQDAYTPMGYVKLERGDFGGAVYYYTRALEFFPLNRDARINRAIAYENLGMLGEALADYRYYLSIRTYNNVPGSIEYAERKVVELSGYDRR